MPKLRESPTLCLPLMLNSLMQFPSKGFSFVLILWNHSNRPWTHQAALNGMKLCIKSAKADLKEKQASSSNRSGSIKIKLMDSVELVTLTRPCVASIVSSGARSRRGGGTGERDRWKPGKKKGTKDKTRIGQQAAGTRNCSTVPLRSTESEADKEKGNLYVKQALNGRRRGEEDKEDQGGRPEREPPWDMSSANVFCNSD